MQYELNTKHQIHICREHVQRLMRLMGLEAIYPKKYKGLSDSDDQHKKYPYLLTNITASFPNHIWGTDITYVRLEHGFAYLVALLDWFSRYVIAWQVSPNLEIEFCLDNLTRGLQINTPQIHNSDQGSHFTSPRYTDLLTQKNVQISMDGRGRCMDNIFTERLWRTVKYENIYLKSYATCHEANAGLADYFRFYNHTRPQQSLGNMTPAQVVASTPTRSGASGTPRRCHRSARRPPTYAPSRPVIRDSTPSVTPACGSDQPRTRTK
jgi:putative transposase